MKGIIVTFDIGGTLGRQTTTPIEELNTLEYDIEHVVPIPGDKFGSFVFFKGVIDMLKTVFFANPCDVYLTTVGFKTPPEKDGDSVANANWCIIEYINNVAGYLPGLRDVTTHVFHPDDIANALIGEMDDPDWQDWFTSLFKVVDPKSLITSTAIKACDMPHWYIRDHAIMFPSLALDSIIHVDDTPDSVAVNDVTVIPIDRTKKDKAAVSKEVTRKILDFIIEKKRL